MKFSKKYIVLLFLFFFFSESFAYRLKDEDVVVVNGIIISCIYDISTKGNVIEIPDVLDGQTIIGIGNYAFSTAGKIAELILPSTLQTIGNGVFEGHALTSLDIPAGVTSIGYRAFYGNALSSINLPSGLKTIEGSAFENNQLQSVTLPDGIISIGYNAFQNNKITSITIPNTLEFLGSSAFESNNISTLNFQTGCQLKEIQPWCFSNNNIQNLSIPNSVLIIGDYAFRSNNSLSNVTFGANLLKIKRGAFNSCNLSSVNLPGSLVFLGRYAFEGNNKLSSIKLPTSSNNYIWNDSNGDKHNAGATITQKYYSYVAIIPYTLTDDDVEVQNGIIINCTFFNDVTNIASVITIPDQLDGQDIIGIGSSGFYDRGISEVVLPAGLTIIEDGAFYYNEIINLTVPNSLVSIGERAFYYNCINTITFETTSTLEVIGMYAFDGNRLITIDFPQSVVIIEKYAFESNFLQNINFEENSRLISIGSNAFWNNSGSLSLTLPDPQVNGYDYWVDWENNQYSTNRVVTDFESFYKIPIEYTLTDSDVEVINGVIVSVNPGNVYANIITIPDVLDGQIIIGIGDQVFRNTGLIGVILPPNLVTVGYGAFSDNEIISLTVPSSVEEINGEAFFRNNINELDFEENSRLRHIGWTAFYNNKISDLTIPDSVNYIGRNAFSYNRISNGITIPDSVEYIGYYAFTGNQIPELIFGENSLLNYLGMYAFAYNKISNEIFIPTTLSEISDYAFLSNLISKVIVHDGIVEYGNGAFQNNNSSLSIVLHKPPTIPFVTHFFWWKDNDGVYHDPGEEILDFSNRYKAVIDQFFVVKFIVVDDNNDPVENASIQIFGGSLLTDINGIDSIGPVLRGYQDYEVSAEGCLDFSGNIDVQDNMTVYVTLIKYFNANINIVDINNNPISDASVVLNASTLISNTNGNVNMVLTDGNYPFLINAAGYQEHPATLTVQDADTTITIMLMPVLVHNFPNGGAGVAFTDTTTGNSYVVNNNPFTRNAYTFSHWNTINDNSGITYSENELIALAFSDIDLFAIWTPVDYNIIYHLDGGTNDTGNPTNYNIESQVNFLPASKTSLYFATWLDADSNRVNRIEVGNTGDVELWAVYTTEPTYFIDYYNLEDATHNNQSTYTQFDLTLAFTDAEKRGYEFVGWYQDDLLTNQITNIPLGSKKDYEIYAKWGNAIDYSISYNLDGGANHSANPVNYTIESNTITFEPPTKTGATFIAWYSNENLINEITEIPQGSIGDTILYAKWDLATYDIQYELAGGINAVSNPDTYTIDSNDILFEPPTKIGEHFIGWFSDNEFVNEIAGITTGSFGDTIVYAKWELNSYDIQYILDGGFNHPENPANYTIESDQIIFEPPTKPGAKFIAWYNDITLIDEITEIPTGSVGDTTIYVKWELDTFTIDYVLAGGINDLANPIKYTIESNSILFEPPTKIGATFLGWYDDDVFASEISGLTTGSYGDTILYAKWELNSFDIQYELDGGINNPDNPATYNIESENILFEAPTKPGSIFLGWFSDKDLTNEITNIPTGTIGDTILYSQWELDTFTIEYVLDGGNNNPANPTSYTVESNTIIFEEPDNSGYSFEGWFTDLNYENSIETIPQGSVGDKTLYAKWTEIFMVQFIITTDGINPAKDVDIVINNSQKLRSDEMGTADTLVLDGSVFNYSVEIDGIVINNGSVTVSGSDVIVRVEIVDCYMRWYDVIFCDNGKGLWTNFVWYKENNSISPEQFYHQPGGIEDGKYKLVVTSIAGVVYIWEKEYKTNNFQARAFPNPVKKSGNLNVELPPKTDLQNTRISIFDVNGSLIKTINNPLYMNKINIDNNFSSGFYHVIILDKQNKRHDVINFVVN